MALKILPGKIRVGDEEKPADIRFYEAGIPEFVESALEALYETHMTTLLRFGQYYPLDCARTYVCRVGGDLRSVIVFRQEGSGVMVYNEQIKISPEEVLRFTRAVFAAYPDVSRISWYAVDAGVDLLPYPYLRLSCLEDISFELPPSVSHYSEMLGKNMSYHIKRYNKKLNASVQDVRRTFLSGAEVPDETIRQITGFSRMRMTAKGQRCYHTDQEIGKTIALVRRYGLVYTVTIGNELAAGVIVLRIGTTHTLQVLAHDPRYDRFSLGTLCCYDVIANAITEGARRFNFGWGRFEYKNRLAGRTTELFRIDAYRTTAALLRDMPAVCQRALLTGRRRAKLWLARPVDEGDVLSRYVRRAWGTARLLRTRLSG